MLPSFVAALALVSAFAQGGLLDELFGIDTQLRIEGFWAAFTVLTVISYPYVYLPVAARLSGMPRSLEESARSLGRSPASVFRTVVLPQARGAILAGSLLVFLYVVSEFGAVALVHYDTLTRRIYSARLLDPTAAMAMSLLLGLVALSVVTAERAVGRHRRRIEATGGGGRPHQTRLGPWKIPAVLGAGDRARARASSCRSRCWRTGRGGGSRAGATSSGAAPTRARSSDRRSTPRCSASPPRSSRSRSCFRSRT